MKNWFHVYENQLYLNPDDLNYIKVRVSATPDCVAVITDIRKFIGKRGARLGVGLFPDELRWFWEKATKKINCSMEFEFRKIRLEFENNITAVTVIKTDMTEQKIYLSDEQLQRLFSIEEEIAQAINKASEAVIN